MMSVRCPVCGHDDVVFNKGRGRYECRVCNWKWRMTSNVTSNNNDKSINMSSNRDYRCVLEEESKEDSQADGLMTLDDDDILFPEEF